MRKILTKNCNCAILYTEKFCRIVVDSNNRQICEAGFYEDRRKNQGVKETERFIG